MKLVYSISLLAFYCATGFAQECSKPTYNNVLDNEYIWQAITALASNDMQGREFGHPGGIAAGDYIAKHLSKTTQAFNGYYKHGFTKTSVLGNKKSGWNIIGQIPGSEFDNKYIVISAHYDHLGRKHGQIFNGADDNASGVAALLALSRYFSRQPTRHSLIFLATDGEESNLAGARAFAKKSPVAIESIVFNVNLDMLGQPGDKRRLYLYSSNDFSLSEKQKALISKKSGLCLRFGRPLTRRGGNGSFYRRNWRSASDHRVFSDHGIPYIFLGVADHKYYHRANDELSKINKAFLFSAADTARLVISEVDNMR